jgi:hypothetical protein
LDVLQLSQELEEAQVDLFFNQQAPSIMSFRPDLDSNLGKSGDRRLKLPEFEEAEIAVLLPRCQLLLDLPPGTPSQPAHGPI